MSPIEILEVSVELQDSLTKRTCLETPMLNTLNIKLKLNQNPALIEPNETNNKYKPLLN